jgi:cytochrome c biogenesis protein CcmG, thiol:disulfide interchange protein DsbE
MSAAGAPVPKRHAKPRAALPVVLGILALVGLLAYGVFANGNGRALDNAVASGTRPPAPNIALPALGGPGNRTLADSRGKVVVLNFWASWCPPCRSETPLLESWQRRMRAHGGTVLGVDVLDVSGDALAFARRYGVSYPLVRDRDGAAARRYGVVGYPETVVIDRRGHVAAVRRGPVEAGFYRSKVEPLLREEP